jgi:hydrogenase maturation protease
VDRVRRIADAVLYEGYVLWPYRRSAVKNQRRWTFGGVYPPAHSALHPDDACAMQTQCLARATPGARLGVLVRFLQVVERRVAHLGPIGREPVEELVVEGERYVPWEEATEREVAVALLELGGRSQARREIRVPAGAEREVLEDAQRRPAGMLTRTWGGLSGSVDVTSVPLGGDVFRITVRIANDTPFDGDDRERALRATLCSTHTIVTIADGELLSLTDPPPDLRDEAERCENIGTWPVLAGEQGERHTILSSPIILPDHPEVAPESPGDLFDAAEIDQLLTLSILSMTEDERAQMRAADPRTRAILERTDALSREELMRLHGAIRERG